MRKVVSLLGLMTLAACSRPEAENQTPRDSITPDTTRIAGPPAVRVDPPPVPAESLAGRPRNPSPPGSLPPAGGMGTPSTPPATTVRPPQPPATVVIDSVRGIVSVVGTSLEKRTMVTPPGSAARYHVTGPQATLIANASGADVLVDGRVSGYTIEATRFVVRSVDGAPAIDGVLRSEGSTLFIVDRAGTRTRIVAPPPPFVGRDGARVWITGDPSRGVASFGFIDPPR